jgi:hypothetical protein
MELEGLRGETLVLYWRLSPTQEAAPLPAVWAQVTPACLMKPGSQLDSASVDIWIPLPDQIGPFVLDFIVGKLPEGIALTTNRTDSFDWAESAPSTPSGAVIPDEVGTRGP